MPLGTAMGSTNWAELGFCAMAMGEGRFAREYFNKGLTVRTATRYLAMPHLLVGSAFLSLAENATDAAADCLKQAREFIEERKMRPRSAWPPRMTSCLIPCCGLWSAS